MSAESRIKFSPILAPPRGNHINFQPLLFAFYTVDLLSCIQLGILFLKTSCTQVKLFLNILPMCVSNMMYMYVCVRETLKILHRMEGSKYILDQSQTAWVQIPAHLYELGKLLSQSVPLSYLICTVSIEFFLKMFVKHLALY